MGAPAEIVAQIRGLAAAGIAEVSLQWTGLDGIDGLELLAAEVLPQLTEAA